MKGRFHSVLKDRSGATALEYGLIAALMSGALIAGFPILRDAVLSLYLIVSATVPGTGN